MTIKAGDKLTISVEDIIITTTVTAVRDQLPLGVSDPSLPEPECAGDGIGFLINDKPLSHDAFSPLQPKPYIDGRARRWWEGVPLGVWPPEKRREIRRLIEEERLRVERETLLGCGTWRVNGLLIFSDGLTIEMERAMR